MRSQPFEQGYPLAAERPDLGVLVFKQVTITSTVETGRTLYESGEHMHASIGGRFI